METGRNLDFLQKFSLKELQEAEIHYQQLVLGQDTVIKINSPEVLLHYEETLKEIRRLIQEKTVA